MRRPIPDHVGDATTMIPPPFRPGSTSEPNKQTPLARAVAGAGRIPMEDAMANTTVIQREGDSGLGIEGWGGNSVKGPGGLR